MLVIIIILVLILFFLFSKIDTDRRVLQNDLVVIYDEMELYFTKNGSYLESDVKRYLRVFKNIAVNPDFLDPKVLIVVSKISEEKRTFTKDVMQNIERKYPTSIEFRKNFDLSAKGLIRINFLKFSNLDICIFCSLMYLIAYLFYRGNKLKKAFDKLLGENFRSNHSTINNLEIPYCV